jgi:hypothetical protein
MGYAYSGVICLHMCTKKGINPDVFVSRPVLVELFYQVEA